MDWRAIKWKIEGQKIIPTMKLILNLRDRAVVLLLKNRKASNHWEEQRALKQPKTTVSLFTLANTTKSWCIPGHTPRIINSQSRAMLTCNLKISQRASWLLRKQLMQSATKQVVNVNLLKELLWRKQHKKIKIEIYLAFSLQLEW